LIALFPGLTGRLLNIELTGGVFTRGRWVGSYLDNYAMQITLASMGLFGIKT